MKKQKVSFVSCALSVLLVVTACGEKIAVDSQDSKNGDDKLALNNGARQRKSFHANFVMLRTLYPQKTKSNYLFVDDRSAQTWKFSEGGDISEVDLSDFQSGEKVVVNGEQVDSETITIDDLSLEEDQLASNEEGLDQQDQTSTSIGQDNDDQSFNLTAKKKKKAKKKVKKKGKTKPGPLSPRPAPTDPSPILVGGTATIFMPVDLKGASAANGVDHASLRAIVFDGPASANNYLRAATSEQVYFADNIDQTKDGIKSSVAVNFDDIALKMNVDPDGNKCDVGQIKKWALAAQTGEIDTSASRIFILSESLAEACNFKWQAAGTMNCLPGYCDSFITENTAAAYAWSIGVNHGLRTASAIDPTDASQTRIISGGDRSCLMGTPASMVNLNPINREIATFLNLENVQNVTDSGTYTLSNYDNPNGIQMIFFNNPIQPSTKYRYYLSIRRAAGLDVGLSSEYVNKVLLHRVDSENRYTDSILLKALAVGEKYVDLDQDFSVQVESIDAVSAKVNLSKIESVDLTTKCAQGLSEAMIWPNRLEVTLSKARPAGVSVTFDLIDNRFSQCESALYRLNLANLPKGILASGLSNVYLTPGAKQTFTLNLKPNKAAVGVGTGHIFLNNQSGPSAQIVIKTTK